MQPRLLFSIVLSLLLGAVIWWLAPQQSPVALFKFYLVVGAGVFGYFFDREVFPYARPDQFLALAKSERYGALPSAKDADFPVVKGYELVFALAQLRRAIIIAGAMLAVGLGA